MNVKELLAIIDEADVLIIANSPYLHSVSVAAVTGEPENEILHINWHDDEGQMYNVTFTEEGFNSAKIFGNKISLPDHEGEACEIRLFDLVPKSIEREGIYRGNYRAGNES